jgi:hypothetical protein
MEFKVTQHPDDPVLATPGELVKAFEIVHGTQPKTVRGSPPGHGTVAAYMRRCRCKYCTEAKRLQCADYKFRTGRGGRKWDALGEIPPRVRRPKPKL